jgi:hypothetical protein
MVGNEAGMHVHINGRKLFNMICLLIRLIKSELKYKHIDSYEL